MSGSANRRALVTGASTGLGRETALSFARAGYDVALADIDAGMLDPVMKDTALVNVNAVAVTLDLRDEDSIRSGCQAAIDGLGGLDVLVNNAAVPLHRAAVDVTWDEWDAVVDVNLKGAYFLSGRFAAHCIEAGHGGAIVNIASTHGMTGLAGRSVYGITKGGLIQMSRMHAIEWAEHGIRVNAVAPTTVMTESRQEILKDPERRAGMLARIPLGDFPEPAEIASAVLFLAAPEQKSVTGHVLAVDGGLTAV
ncbi:MAG: SDR family oxidoreductase [Alphaproteobacteria bacterium]|nr:SDR family oxidoreductase [Alphaproteobacteria bacterium]